MNRQRGLGAAVSASALVLVAACGSGGSGSEGGDGPATVTIVANAISGGKNAASAEWIEDWVIPEFEAALKADGRDVTVVFEAQGVDDEDYKTKIALDLQSGSGADVIGLDGIWVGEFAEAGYIQPLVGGEWQRRRRVGRAGSRSPTPSRARRRSTVPALRHPAGRRTGGCMYYNKELFAQAGLPEDWQPTSLGRDPRRRSRAEGDRRCHPDPAQRRHRHG